MGQYLDAELHSITDSHVSPLWGEKLQVVHACCSVLTCDIPSSIYLQLVLSLTLSLCLPVHLCVSVSLCRSVHLVYQTKSWNRKLRYEGCFSKGQRYSIMGSSTSQARPNICNASLNIPDEGKNVYWKHPSWKPNLAEPLEMFFTNQHSITGTRKSMQ